MMFKFFHIVFTNMCYSEYNERNGDITMNSVRRFKTLLSILMLYASNLIVHDKVVVPAEYTVHAPDKTKRITGTVFPKLTTSEK